VPVNADFEGGYADEPAGVAESVRLCCETGVAGLSIEDSTGNKDKPLYDIPFAVERMKAARAAIDKAGADVMLTGRAEGFISGVRRISVGGALARSAWGGFMRMAKEIVEQGTFTGFKDAASGAELNGFFAKDRPTR